MTHSNLSLDPRLRLLLVVCGCCRTLRQRCSTGSLGREIPGNFPFPGKRAGNFRTSGIPEIREIPGNFPGISRDSGISREISREFPVSREFPGKISREISQEFPEIREIPEPREIPETREIPEIREFPGNSRTGNSREGNFPGLTGGREREFPVEHH